MLMRKSETSTRATLLQRRRGTPTGISWRFNSVLYTSVAHVRDDLRERYL